MKNLFIILTIFLSTSSFASQEFEFNEPLLKKQKSGNSNTDLEVIFQKPIICKVKEGLFTSSIQYGTETLYFGFQHREENIEFTNFINNQVTGLHSLYDFVCEIMDCKLGREETSETYCKLLEAAPQMNAEKYVSNVHDLMKYAECCPNLAEYKKVRARLSSILDGAEYSNIPGFNLFAWISTKPILDYRNFGCLGEIQQISPDQPELYFQGITENQDLVAVISGSFKNSGLGASNHLMVQGVHKTMHEILYGNHPGISMLLHGFLARIACDIYDKKVYSVVDTAPGMARILYKHLILKKPYRGLVIREDVKDLMFASLRGEESHNGTLMECEEGKTPFDYLTLNFSSTPIAEFFR
ncbi:MAG: hypothetical protein ACPGXY_04595 [Alphaproteobacteria bacterium]